MEPVGALVFRLLVLGEVDGRWTRAIRALRADPHLQVTEALEIDAPVDVVIVVAATVDELGPILARVRADVPLIVCDSCGNAHLIGLADVLVNLAEPRILVETVRWLLGLPSWVAPAHRSAVRRLMSR